MRIKVDIYSISTVDNLPVETIIERGVTGEIEVDTKSFKTNKNSIDVYTLYCFIPDKLYDNIYRGHVMRFGEILYTIQFVENQESHNEIYCRRQS